LSRLFILLDDQLTQSVGLMTRTGPIKRVRGLYLITDHGELLLERVSEALPYTDVLQFRSKDHAPSEKIRLGKELRELCRGSGTLFIINDDPHLARDLDADGVHLGQEDGDPAEARRIIGEGKLVGISTHSPQEALSAEVAGADYIGFGAMFPTGSKEIAHLAGIGSLAETRKTTSLPIVAIGGISRDNAPSVIDAGADAIAVISAVMSHHEPSLAAAELDLLFNRKQALPAGTVLTVAGSDSGGGAGIQADLKTITLLGSYGASVITALTAQNTLGVTGIHPAPADFVAAQLDAVLSDIPVDVVKTGMLFSADIINAIAEKVSSFRKRILVVDPVMIAKGGADLIDRPAVDAFKKRLLPMTYLLTPNIPEAEALTGIRIETDADLQRAAQIMHQEGARNILIKGGHANGEDSVDQLFDGNSFIRFPSKRFDSINTHGTGCTLSAAIATFLAQGNPLPEAVRKAKEFITAAIRLAVPLGKGHGPVNHYLAAQAMREQGSGNRDQ
jgi:hydroxymethylpyrimidine kinase / phosphomethylpyrimidine kinase / thiamine-phosphate diphosphorylase